MARRRPEPPDECSQCGASVPKDALACPECGADEQTGWDANPWLPNEGELDIPDYLIDDYDRDTDGPALPGDVWLPRKWRPVAVIVIAGLALSWFWFMWHAG